MKSAHLLLLAVLFAGCQAIADPEEDADGPDQLCPALQAFAEGIPAGEAQRVTLRTFWDAQPTIACERPDTAPAKAFCAYLSANSSVEFMSTNIRRVMRCAGISHPETPDDLYRMVGQASTLEPAFTRRAVKLDLTFDTTGDAQRAPFLTIALTPKSMGKSKSKAKD
jgi:hypothetical protein